MAEIAFLIIAIALRVPHCIDPYPSSYPPCGQRS